MKKHPSLILGILFLFLASALLIALSETRKEQTPLEKNDTAVTRQTHTEDVAKLSFSYPNTYYLLAKETGTDVAPIRSIVLAEDTPEHRAILEGRSTEVREGPPTITIDIYRSRPQKDIPSWIATYTNWKLGDKALHEVTVSGQKGYTFNWSGLYEGRSIVVIANDMTYVFSVNWNTPSDEILKEFALLLYSVDFSPEQTNITEQGSTNNGADNMTGTIPNKQHSESNKDNDRMCIQVITTAKNAKTGEVRDFPTPCDVPEGWDPQPANSAGVAI